MTIISNIQHIQQLIADTARQCHRPAGDIRLLAVSKGQPANALRSAFQAGLHDFGESYWQEAQGKQAQLADLPITWHFIGPVQGNKAADIARHFQWVHSLDRAITAQRLAAHRPDTAPALNVCLQVNLDDETSKAGVTADALPSLIESVRQWPNLRLRGLMTLPKPRTEEDDQYQSFLRLAVLLDTLNQRLSLSMDTLSMGMSDDLIPAIRAGSTLVRIGRALFGERS